MPLPNYQPRAFFRILRSGELPIVVPRGYAPKPQWLPRAFTTSTALRRHDISKARNHYEVLNVAYDATPAEIKKSFYSLSKSYHPDHNPGDASTIAKFHSISEAYSVLGTPAKRAAYDRDVISHHHGANAPRRGSYHSSGHAGGRPASGLSRRKTQFRGPPPSFHRSGGWGAHSAKRSAAHDESTGGGGSATGPGEHPPSGAGAAPSGGWTAGPKAGMGPGQDPFGHTLESEPAHFDRASHRRTQQAQDHRRTARILRDSGATSGGQESMLGMFFAVSGVLFLTFFLPYVFLGGLRRNRSSDKGDGKKKKDA